MNAFSFLILAVTQYARQPLKCTQEDEDATCTSSCQIPCDPVSKCCFYEIRFDTFKASKSSSLKLCCTIQKSAKTVSHNHSCHKYCSFLVLCWTDRHRLHSPFIVLCFSSRSLKLFSQKGSFSKKRLYKTLGSSSRLQVSVCLSVVWSTESHKSLLSWRQGANSQKLGSKSCDSPTARAIQLLYMTDLCSDVQLLSREFNKPADSVNKESEWAAMWWSVGDGWSLPFFIIFWCSLGFLTSSC